MKMLVQNQLVGDAYLVIRTFETQLVKRLLKGVHSREVEVDSIKNLVIGNTSFYYIICGVRLPFTAGGDKVKPFAVVSVKDYVGYFRQNFVKFVNIEKSLLAFS